MQDFHLWIWISLLVGKCISLFTNSEFPITKCVRPEGRFAEFMGLRTFDASSYFWYFRERSNSVAIEIERFSFKFSESWPLPIDALILYVTQHLLLRKSPHGSMLLRYFSGLWPDNNLPEGDAHWNYSLGWIVRICNSTYGKIFASYFTALTFSYVFSWAVVADNTQYWPTTIDLIAV